MLIKYQLDSAGKRKVVWSPLALAESSEDICPMKIVVLLAIKKPFQHQNCYGDLNQDLHLQNIPMDINALG